MLTELKERVYRANMMLVKNNLIVLTWGNASEIDREKGIVAIKPSGVPYDKLQAKDIVLTDLDGNVIEGELRPSTDLLTHLTLYKEFDSIGGVVHTHSVFATSFAQAECPIPCYGTTHADYFYGNIPCTRNLTEKEISDGYEMNTGKVIAETFICNGLDAKSTPGVLVSKHGPFVWGKDAQNAVEMAMTMECVAQMALNTLQINSNVNKAPQYLMDKHYLRKHGNNAYYGQK